MQEKKIRQKKKKETKERAASYSYKYLLELPWKEECSQLIVASCLTEGMQQILTILLQEQERALCVQGVRGRVSNALITACWLHTTS